MGKLHQSSPSCTTLHQVAPIAPICKKRYMATTPRSQAVGEWSHGLDIDREDWEQGYGLFRLDLTAAIRSICI